MEDINKILEQKAVRITPMRQLLLEYFIQKNAIVGLSKLEEAFPVSDRITMYRTLKTFEEKGIIHSINNGTNEVKYGLCSEYCTPGNHFDRHPHFQCLRCNEFTCLENTFIPTVELPEKFTATEINMNIKGICPDCQK